jgi:hypothetical protein
MVVEPGLQRGALVSDPRHLGAFRGAVMGRILRLGPVGRSASPRPPRLSNELQPSPVASGDEPGRSRRPGQGGRHANRHRPRLPRHAGQRPPSDRPRWPGPPRRPPPGARERPATAHLDRARARARAGPSPPRPQPATGPAARLRSERRPGWRARRHRARSRIDRLTEGTYYAVVGVDGPQGASEVDARPSDPSRSPWWSAHPSGPTAPSSR